MARSSVVGLGVFGLAMVLFAVLIIVPFLKETFPQFYEAFEDLMTTSSRKPDCVGVTCPEGSFCQTNKCIPIFPQ